jgi:hypothetical protein
MNEIHVHNVPKKSYTVQIVYADFDSHDDKPYKADGPEMWNIIIETSNSLNAVQDAVKIVGIERAIIMTDYMRGANEVTNQDTYTIEDIEVIRKRCEDDGVFRDWLLIEPTSIQVCLTDDVKTLQSMTAESVMHDVSKIGDEAEDFLKKGTTNDDA